MSEDGDNQELSDFERERLPNASERAVLGIEKRGTFSKILTVAEFLAFVAFLAGGITLFVLTGQQKSDGYGGLPFLVKTITGEEDIWGRNIYPGFMLATAMIVLGVGYFFLLIRLYKYPSQVLSNLCRKRDLRVTTEAKYGQRRSDTNRLFRQYLMIFLTWSLLPLAMHQAVGEYEVATLIPLTFIHVLSLFIIGSIQMLSVNVRDLAKRKPPVEVLTVGTAEHLQAHSNAVLIGAGSILSAICLVIAFMFLWIDFSWNRDTPGTFVHTRFETPMYMITIISFVYWALATCSSNYNLSQYQPSYIWVFTFIPDKLLGWISSLVMDRGINEEAFTLVLNFVLFSVFPYMYYQDVITERATIPL